MERPTVEPTQPDSSLTDIGGCEEGESAAIDAPASPTGALQQEMDDGASRDGAAPFFYLLVEASNRTHHLATTEPAWGAPVPTNEDADDTHWMHYQHVLVWSLAHHSARTFKMAAASVCVVARFQAS